MRAYMAGVQIDFSGKIRVLVRPNSKKTEILGFDDVRKAWRIAVTVPAEDNKANLALVKFLSKLSKKRVRIVSGLSSKEKVLEFS